MRREEILQHCKTLLDVEAEIRDLNAREEVTPVKNRYQEALEHLGKAELLLKEASFILLGTVEPITPEEKQQL